MKHCRRAQPLAIVDRRITTDDFTGSDVVGNTGLRRGDHAVADAAVAGDANLSGEHHVAADLGRAREPDLRAQQRVLAHTRSVADLHQVVDLRAVGNDGRADAGAVDAGIGLDLDIAADAHRPGLRNLVPGAVIALGEAKAIAADHDPVLKNDAVAEHAALADDGMGMGEEITAHRHAGIEDDVGEQDRSLADPDAFTDDGIGADVRAGPMVALGSITAVGWMPAGKTRRGMQQRDGLAKAR